ncbi:MAG: aconitate hydratase 1 [Spirochaeta sp. LUC14_002_19_P3]|nr:MAG: aconitate hydratase 1 [Spirochaeta sp. LUC14_002_19_P3]
MNTDTITIKNKTYEYYGIAKYAEAEGLDISRLPISIKILLENLLRCHESPAVDKADIRALASWSEENKSGHGIAYHPARVVMQDFTGVPAIVDLAAMRDALAEAGGDVSRINPLVPVDLVIDHSVMVDNYGSAAALDLNVMLEFKRNQERYRFLKWGQRAFDNFRVVPPGTGIIHQVNLEYLAQVVWTQENGGKKLVYPDTVVGTDSHTTMINALGVLGWGVGGIEAEAAMLGQPVTMLIPEVVGMKLEGNLAPGCTATDLVLTVVKMLREKKVVGKFVEFFGPGLSALSLADRATISNMAPEYGATCGFFPIDDELLSYLALTGREEDQIALVKQYARIQGLWRDDAKPPRFSDTLSLDLSRIVPAMAGPRRPQDLVPLNEAPENFRQSLGSVYGVSGDKLNVHVPVSGMNHELTHGDAAIAAITSCTNTSNPAVLIAAGLVAKKAHERGLKSKPWVKTSFAPGSQAATAYLEKAGLSQYLDALGFQVIGYGCTTCIGNSGPLPAPVKEAIDKGGLVTVNVLSGNRNFEGRVSPDSKASYLASPPLVVAYALAGTILIDFENDPLAEGADGKPVYLRDIWPSTGEVQAVMREEVNPTLFSKVYANVFAGTERWRELDSPQSNRYDWEADSTYIRRPPFFDSFNADKTVKSISGARCLAILPDSTTTDHISPAGNIPANGPAGLYLTNHGVKPVDFNSFGSRRGNHEVMMRGTFANIRIKNAMADGKEGGYTRGPDGKVLSIYDAAMAWAAKDVPLVVIAGREYGTGSSRDWAGKGPMLLGVKAVIAESYERIHRSNLIGMGVLPLEFAEGGSAASHNLDGSEEFTIAGLDSLKPRQALQVSVRRSNGSTLDISVLCRIDTEVEMAYWRSGGILNYVLRRLCREE